ncbi:MAG: hypothetical protein U0990_12705 [Candidatus Nanopelagicales bacterium]|nr:hypothetical protein [Candidatus Nanopelagicales bacterium]
MEDSELEAALNRESESEAGLFVEVAASYGHTDPLELDKALQDGEAAHRMWQVAETQEAKLRAAVREWAVKAHNDRVDTDPALIVWWTWVSCRLCLRVWRSDETEAHDEGCPAAAVVLGPEGATKEGEA